MELVKRVLGLDQLPGGLPPAPGAPAQQPAPLTFDERLAGIKALVDGGFAAQVMLSNDWIQFVIRKVIPGLKRIGVQDQSIRTMTVPKRFFDRA